jgi:hypothetical protein
MGTSTSTTNEAHTRKTRALVWTIQGVLALLFGPAVLPCLVGLPAALIAYKRWPPARGRSQVGVA